MSIYDTEFLEKARDCSKEHRADPSHWQALHDAASFIDMAIAEANHAQVDQTFEVTVRFKGDTPSIRLTLRNSPREIKRVLAELKVSFEGRTDFKSFHAHVLTTFRTAVEV